MKSRILGAIAGTTVIAGALMVVPYANAGPSPAPAPAAAAPGVAPAMLAAMTRDLHLTKDQALARFAADRAARTSEVTVRARLGARYAGAWLSEDGALTVGATTDADAATARSLGVRSTRVTRTEQQLDAVRSGLDQSATQAPRAVHSWYVDPATNKVVVAAENTAAADSFVASAGVDKSAVQSVVKTADAPRLMADIRGGDEYRINGNTLCSIGFSVAGGFVTAGHCGGVGSPTSGSNGTPQGTFRGSTFPGNDYGWVQVNGGWTPQPVVNTYNGGTTGVAGSQEAGIGAAVCRSGRTTGWRCGVIQAKNVTVSYPQGAVRGLTQSNACAQGGDSGGSWLAGDQAQGVTSGGSGNCSTGGTMFFQPLLPILSRYSLSLLTTGGGGGGNAIIGYGGRCIDIPGGNANDGQFLVMYGCNRGPNQQWAFASDGTVRSMGKCMDVANASTADGAVIQIANCNGNPAQQFVLSGAGDLVNPRANKCVDVQNWVNANNARLVLWTCTGGANQKWRRG